ncbi:hypothetical protein NUW54_g13856 [Trametes sanguinea]|uniref:Uncharacterized protein n=1 Tax=Trametes sanguinea TaxID=158606 RepID=A0ACC1MGY9_9APHY|nr:hypothetical protein NUW54_g13856 [Trametes sanguinea]
MLSDNRGTGTTLSDNSRSELVEKPADESDLALEDTIAASPAAGETSTETEDGGNGAWLTVAGACVHMPEIMMGQQGTWADDEGVV